jgi:hypothetical protein
MGMKSCPELSIIIVNYNGRSFLKLCLSAVKENAKPADFEMIVVDNGSKDGSSEFLRENFPWVKLIRNKKNFGYAKANNQGIRRARGEFVLFLNPDTRIFPGALHLLCEGIKASPSVGAVGPALLSEENRHQVSFGRKVDFTHEVLQKCLLNFYFRRRLKNMRRKFEVGWLSGACLMTRRSVLEETGYFDENYFLYFEDIDLCQRIQKTGRKLMFLPQAKVLHFEGTSTQEQKLFSLYCYRQSQLYFYKKHNSRLSLFFLRGYLSLNFVGLFLSGCFRGRNKRNFIRRFFRLLRNE